MRLLTQKEAARRLGVSQSTVKMLRIDRKLTYIPGRPVLIDEADLDAYITAQLEAIASKAAYMKAQIAKKAEKRQARYQPETPAQRARRVWIVRRARALMKVTKPNKPKP